RTHTADLHSFPTRRSSDLSLAHGGHLTHGAAVNMSGKIFNSVAYGLNPETEEIDYAELERLAHEHKPRMIVAGASSYARVIDWKDRKSTRLNSSHVKSRMP